MFHKAKTNSVNLPSECCVDVSKSNIFHPLSYYLNGGIDLEGEALDKSAEVEFDNEEQFKELEAEGAMSVPYGDPRMSKFRLVEQMGNKLASAVASKSATANSADIAKAQSVNAGE